MCVRSFGRRGQSRESGGEEGATKECWPGPLAGGQAVLQEAVKGKQMNKTIQARGHHGQEAGKEESQTRPGLSETFVLRAAAVSWGNRKENTF